MSITIGEVARRCAVSVDTVRYYERRGLVTPVTRTAGNYRVFGAEAVDRITTIRTLQSVGMSLDDVAGVFARAGDGLVACDHVDGTLETVIAKLDATIAELTGVRDHAAATLTGCRGGACDHGCVATGRC